MPDSPESRLIQTPAAPEHAHARLGNLLDFPQLQSPSVERLGMFFLFRWRERTVFLVVLHVPVFAFPTPRCSARTQKSLTMTNETR